MPKINKNKQNTKKKNMKRHKFWVVKIFIATLMISAIFSIASQNILSASDNLILPLFIIILIILIGVIFDIIGIAVTSAPKTPFISMSAKKVRGAKQSLYLIKNADLVSNFCNDVVGDICGIISGAAGSMLVLKMFFSGLNPDILAALMSGLIAAMTVGAKSLGKSLAISNSKQIIYGVGCFLSFFSREGSKVKR